MSIWNEKLGLAIRLIGQIGLPRALEEALGAVLPFRICMVFSYDGNRKPQALHHNMPADVAAIVVGDYIAGPYLLDPFYTQLRASPRDGVFHLRDLAPDSFFRSEYFLKHYRRTGIRDELGIPCQIAPGVTIILSVARTMEAPAFTRSERRRLTEIAPIISALIFAHWGQTRPATDPGRAETPQLETVLRALAQDRLTAREIEVIGMVLKGYSAAAIAEDLSISHGTVKVHRKNAYRKLHISSQAELFLQFINVGTQI